MDPDEAFRIIGIIKEKKYVNYDYLNKAKKKLVTIPTTLVFTIFLFLEALTSFLTTPLYLFLRLSINTTPNYKMNWQYILKHFSYLIFLLYFFVLQ